MEFEFFQRALMPGYMRILGEEYRLQKLHGILLWILRTCSIERGKNSRFQFQSEQRFKFLFAKGELVERPGKFCKPGTEG